MEFAASERGQFGGERRGTVDFRMSSVLADCGQSDVRPYRFLGADHEGRAVFVLAFFYRAFYYAGWEGMEFVPRPVASCLHFGGVPVDVAVRGEAVVVADASDVHCLLVHVGAVLASVE